MNTTSNSLHPPLCASGLLILMLSLVSCDFLPDVGSSSSSNHNPEVTVMTRNLYLGADFNVILGAQSPAEIPLRVSEFYGHVQATNYPERVKALADEIAEMRPHLIGLQEVALYRMQSPSDYIQGVTEPNAQEVVLDFLALLQAELAARDLPYRVVNESENVDEELPGAVSATEFFDLRLTLRNVILARPNVRTTDSESVIYQAKLEIPIGGGSATFTRSYGWITARLNGVPFTFVNTHLETEAAPPIQVAQANELMQAFDDAEGPVILVGDFNSAADGSTTSSYAGLTTLFTDAFSATHPGVDGYTCCQAANLRNAASTLDRRIDLILLRGTVDATSAQRIGDLPADRTPSGLWPSDHAGVTGNLRLDGSRVGLPATNRSAATRPAVDADALYK